MVRASDQVFWQAHRGGGLYEAPDNTMGANRYAWGLGGIPEADIRTTKDGVIVCLHDDTPARTTTAPDTVKNRSISEFTYEETQLWDAGLKFNSQFAGERIPSIEKVFSEMQGRPERQMYLDLKKVDLVELGRLIDRYEVNGQVIFTHNIQDNCIQMKKIARGVRSMLWIGGTSERIMNSFQQAWASQFQGLDQVQLHLRPLKEPADWPYELDASFLQRALSITRDAGVDLELLPFSIEKPSIHKLLELGIRWYATDEPAKFLDCVNDWANSN